MMASIVSKAIIQGDTQRLDFLLNRLVGKVVDQVSITVTPKPLLIMSPDNESMLLTHEDKNEGQAEE